MAEPKTRPTSERFEDFLNRMTDESIRADCFKLVDLMKRASGDEPVMWGEAIVGFGSYRLRYANGSEADWPLTGFAPRKQNLTLYSIGGFEEYDDLINKLGKHSTRNACLYIKRLADVDLAVLEELVRKSVEHKRLANP